MPRVTKMPYFSGLPNESITEFLQDYTELADGHRLTAGQKVETILHYIPYWVKDLWKTLLGYNTGNWRMFRRELKRLYSDMDTESCYTKQVLTELVDQSARNRICDEKDVIEYYQQFLAISNPLHTTNTISEDKHNTKFFKGFHPEDWMAMTNHLYPLHLGRPRNKPYKIKDVLTIA